jgi:hypothetical protein
VGYELDQTRLVGLKGLTSRSNDFKVGRKRGFGGKGTDLPSGCLTDTNLGLADAGRLLVGGNDMSDDTGYLELFGSLTISYDSVTRM